MLKIYEKCLLPTAERCFIKQNEDWILQKDNDPKTPEQALHQVERAV